MVRYGKRVWDFLSSVNGDGIVAGHGVGKGQRLRCGEQARDFFDRTFTLLTPLSLRLIVEKRSLLQNARR